MRCCFHNNETDNIKHHIDGPLDNFTKINIFKFCQEIEKYLITQHTKGVGGFFYLLLSSSLE